MEASRPSPQSSREQITLPTIEGFEDSGGRVCLSRATTSTFAIDCRRPTESPSSAFGRTASPVACASTASTAIVGGNNPLPLVSTIPVRHIEAMGSDAGKVTVGAGNSPDPPLPSHYDAVIFHDVRDAQRAELFRMRLLDMLGPAGEGLLVSVFGYQADLGRSYYEHLEDTVRRSTYLMLFVTRNLCEDRVVGALLRDQLLSEMLDNREKRWCLIPIWTEPEEEYTKPMALRPLMGIAEKSMSDKLRREGVVRLFTDKRSSRLAREQAEREQQTKEAEQKLQKLKDDEAERQHKERLQQLNDDHQRELRNAQREAELASLLKKNELARLEEDNSALVGNQLMQMQFIQQSARHLRDQHVLEEWQRDAQAQAQMMAGCQMPGRAPSVLRPRGGNGPLFSNGNLWASTIGPDGQAYVALAAGSGSPMYMVPVSQLPDNSGSPASCFSQTVTAGRAASGTRSWASEPPPLPPVRSCTPEETLRQAHDLLQRLNLESPQPPPSVDPQPPPYSELFGSPADVLPSRIFTGAPPSGKDATPATGISAVRSQEKKPQPYLAPQPDVQETWDKNGAGATLFPTHFLGDAVNKVGEIRKFQQALLRDCAEQRHPVSSASLLERQPVASAVSSSSDVQLRSEGLRPGLSGGYDCHHMPERPAAHGAEQPSYRYPSESNFSVIDSPGWQGYSRAVQPRDTSHSYVASDAYTSSVQQPLPAPQLYGAAAAGCVPIDPQLQLPPGFVAFRVEEFPVIRAMLHQLRSPPGNVYWPSTGGQLQQQAPPPSGLPIAHTGTAPRFFQSQSVPAYIGDVAGNSYDMDMRFRLGLQRMPYSDSSPMLARDTWFDHNSAGRLPTHVDFASVPGRATSHRDAASPRASDHPYSSRQSNSQCMPVSAPFADTGSRHRVSSSSQPSSWANTGRDFSSFGSGQYPAALGYGDAPLGTGSSSASEGAGSFSSGPSSVGSEGSRGGASSSLDSGHGPAASAFRASPSSLSSAGRSGNIPLTVVEQCDSSHGTDMQPLTLHPTH